ncbi:MAG: Resolvase/invertase-type recombinase catalytic protein [Dehalococcoidia bacterium]|nr:Resolvase/invertase-type recombinase catalytic protein [Dehalococcoidia bacterium]
MTNERPLRASLWLRVSTDTKGQDPTLQRGDLERVCQQRGWEIVQGYEVEESGFGKKPREQFQAMLEDARRGKFDVLVVWSMDRFSREGEWSVSRIMASLQDWHVQFYSYNEPFLDTTGPFAGFLIPLFAWLARQESIRKGKAVKLGMEKAKAQGKSVGRPSVVDRVDAELVARLRGEGKSWREIAQAHPPVKSGKRKVRPSVGTIRRA